VAWLLSRLGKDRRGCWPWLGASAGIAPHSALDVGTGMKRFRGPRVVASMRAAEARSASGTGSDAGAEALERTW